ncbi:pyruvate carboxylase [Arthrobacter sp. UYNi723]
MRMERCRPRNRSGPSGNADGKAGLGELVNEHLKLPVHFGANAGLKVTTLVAGMVAGADSIDDMGTAAPPWDGETVRGHLCAFDAGLDTRHRIPGLLSILR